MSNLIKTSHEISPSCYEGVFASFEEKLSSFNIQIDNKEFVSHVYIKGDQNLDAYKSFEVFNHLGQLTHEGIMTSNHSKSLKINLEMLKTGIYILKIKSSVKVERFKIKKK
jgi:hypothetical protein